MKLTQWSHASDKPFHTIRISKSKLYYRIEGGTIKGIVTEICCGERYASIQPGLLFFRENYRGSYSDNWHGGPTGSLTDIIRWLVEAEHPEHEWRLWMVGNPTKRYTDALHL